MGMRTILISGILLGPAALALWGLILQLRGDDPNTIWQGDPLIGMGGISAIVFALIVGSSDFPLCDGPESSSSHIH